MPSLANVPGDDPLLLSLGGGRVPASLLGDPLLATLPGVPDAPAPPAFQHHGPAGMVHQSETRAGGLDARAFLSDLRAAEAPDAAGPVDVSELLRELRAQELPFASAAAQVPQMLCLLCFIT